MRDNEGQISPGTSHAERHSLLSQPQRAVRSLLSHRAPCAVWCSLWLVLTLSSLGCKPGDAQKTEASPSTEVEEARPTADSRDAEQALNAAESQGEAGWDLASLRTVWAGDGWSIDADAPDKPSVATPDGTAVEGLALQRGDTRGELFLYTYSREGYARAHKGAELAHSASRRRGAQLLVVYSADAARAESLLESLFP